MSNMYEFVLKDKTIVECESAVILLTKIKAYLGDADFVVLVNNATEVAELQEEEVVV